MHSSQIGKRRTKSRACTKFESNIFAAVNDAAIGRIKSLAEGWVSKSRLSGANLVMLNPTRADRRLGSFCINTQTGVWVDFATDDRGGDIISLYAYLHGLTQIDAARELADYLGVDA